MPFAHAQELLEQFGDLPREVRTCCPVCGHGSSALLAHRDRHGAPLRTVVCLCCGLVYLGDGFCPDAWERFLGPARRTRQIVVRVEGGPAPPPPAVFARDLSGGFHLLRARLPDHALVVCEIPDLLARCRTQGPPQAVAESDQRCWILQETADRVFACLGFEVLSADTSADPWVTYVLRTRPPVRPSWNPCDPQLQTVLREFREMDAHWRRRARLPRNRLDYLRHKAYRLKRLLIRTLGLS